MASKKFTLTAGDRVAFTAVFCRSIGEVTGEIPFMRGTVQSVRQTGTLTVVSVLWDGEDEPRSSRLETLAKVGPNTRFCAC